VSFLLVTYFSNTLQLQEKITPEYSKRLQLQLVFVLFDLCYEVCNHSVQNFLRNVGSITLLISAEHITNCSFRDNSHLLLRGPPRFGFLSVVLFAFVFPIPSIFILVRLHYVHCIASWSLSAQFHSNDAAGRVGLKGRNYPAGAQERRQLKMEL
jgi:hypothetical protein